MSPPGTNVASSVESYSAHSGLHLGVISHGGHLLGDPVTSLLPEFARLTLTGEGVQRFHGTALVPIDGVDFLPYMRVLLKQDVESGHRIARRVAVITDGDKGSAEKTARSRIHDLNALITATGTTDLARVFHNEFTLEPEILRAGP
ncbi:hypothetical protein [Streptomyces sp. NPDC057363]|uniref:hypothetical protein n=1 Tax=Streptomyces sp. NPDC057363 TaxID=3346107 RepID=UPI00362D3D4E